MSDIETHPVFVEGLRLLGQSPEDLRVLSAALQDSVLRLGDIQYDAKRCMLTLLVNRYCWERKSEDASGWWPFGAKRTGYRVRSAIQFGDVRKLERRNLKHGQPDAVVSLMDLDFTPALRADPEDGPVTSGTLLLRFAGDADLRLTLDCIDVILADVSAPWAASRMPEHRI
ncbi:MAG: DUF2948 family protein [Asticcacaulis sp.]